MDRPEPAGLASRARVGGTRPAPLLSLRLVLDLNVDLLSDWNAEAIRGFGISQDWGGMHDVAQRSAFLVDQDGTVSGAWAFDSTEVPDFDELLQAAQAS